MRDLYTEKYKQLMEKTHLHGLEELILLFVVPKVINGVNVVSTKTPMAFLTEIEK